MQNQVKLAYRIKEMMRDFEVIKGIKQDIADEDYNMTMHNLQGYTELIKHYVASINTLQYDCMGVVTPMQYKKLQTIIQKIKKVL